MIRAVRAVRGRRPTELRHRHQRHAASVLGRERRVERLDREVQVAQQVRVPVGLLLVVVEAVEADVEHAHADVRVDQLRRDCELLGEPAWRQRAGERRRDLGRDVELPGHRRRERVVPLSATWGRVRHPADAGVHPRVLGLHRCAEQLAWCDRDGATDGPHHVQRHGRVDRGRGHVGCRRGLPVEPAADPAGAGSAAEAAVHPDAHRREVREVRVRVADALHDGELAGIVQTLQVAELGVEPARPVEREDRRRRDGDVRSHRLVRRIGERHDGVEPVVAAVEHDDDEDPVGRADGSAGPCLGDVTEEAVTERADGHAAEHAHADGLEERPTRPAERSERAVVHGRDGEEVLRVLCGDVGIEHSVLRQAMLNSGVIIVVVSRFVGAHHSLPRVVSFSA